MAIWKKKGDHPREGKFYYYNGNLVEVQKVMTSSKPIMRRKPKEKWFHTQEYEETGEIEETLDDVWWWTVGENKLPGKGLVHSTQGATNYDWETMNLKASVLIHQARIIHTLQKKDEK